VRSDDLHCVGELYTENDFRELVGAASLGGLSEFLASADTARYGLRKQTPEPVFGIIKSAMEPANSCCAGSTGAPEIAGMARGAAHATCTPSPSRRQGGPRA